MKTKHKTQICPRCKNPYEGYPALSRRDNKTSICSDCGTQEALFDFNIERSEHLDEKLKIKARKLESEWLTGGK
ncbi:hypothetical protein CMI37_30070 [Candidatus Pacearchaeota archaeon]|nr:hypothetical protein [Candidatus Pacearchaeota archaeon]